jgi:ABC-2 type transport system ATP-binding protein
MNMVDNPSGVISVTGLEKRFERVTAVAGIDFEVFGGELFGFLGPNGAGKTTTINMLTGLARPDAGTIRVGGIDCLDHPRAAQHLIGVVPDESNLYPELTGFENLCFCAALYGMGKKERQIRARQLLGDFDLTPAADRKFAGYSKGMKRKLTIAAGIVHHPKILFLDEPTTGIDVAAARQLRRLISDLHRTGTTIFLTTHYIEEAQRLCDRVAFIVEGRIVRIEKVVDLLQPLQSRHVLQISCASQRKGMQADLAGAFPACEFTIPMYNTIRVEADTPIGVGPLVRFLEDRGAEVIEARRVRPSLEDVFVSITGIEAQNMRKEKAKGRKGR